MKERTDRAIFVGLLSLLMLGMGQLYNSQPLKGIALFAGALGLLLTSAWLGLADTFRGLLLFLAAALAIYAYGLYDAITTAWKQERVRKRYNRWYVYLLILVLVGIALRPAVVGLSPIRTYRIPSGSMSPTILPGDHICVRTNSYRESEPERGDIVVYGYPKEPSREFLHRIVALPGETIRIEDKRVLINGEPLDEAHAYFASPSGSEATITTNSRQDKITEVMVPEGHYYILGDNRDNVIDSRVWGTLPKELVRGKALYVYLAEDWRRIGTALN